MKLPTVLIVSTFLLVLLLTEKTNSAVLPASDNGEQIGLYSTTDDLTILTASNFYEKVIGDKSRVWLVEFYNTYCGFCQRFAPSWKTLASNIKDWQDRVSIGVLDCSSEQNYKICREFEIMTYPSLRFFHEDYVKGAENIGDYVMAGDDVQAHRDHLMNKLVYEQWQGRATVLPNLLPYNYTDSSKAFQAVPDAIKYVFMVLQEPESHIGPELTMDLHQIDTFAIKYAYNNNTQLVKELHVEEFPSIVAFKRNSPPQIVPVTVRSREGFRVALRDYLSPEQITVPITEPKNKFEGKWAEADLPDMSKVLQNQEKAELRNRIKQMGDVVFQVDLETVLRYALKHEVGTVKEITGEKKTALENFLNVLVKYFPFGKNGHSFLVQLQTLVANSASITGEQIEKVVSDAEKEENQVFSSPPQWLGCSSSSPNKRHYPCGLWKLFHYLTVNAAEQNRLSANANPREVLDAMHGYIKNFFGCSECSQHFQAMAARREITKVDSMENAILWLWKAHNEVNRRLAGDATEDAEFPKQQFPVKERCLVCYNSDGTWNEVEVLSYLKRMYANINIRYIGSDTRILHMGLEGQSVAANGTPSYLHAIDTTRVQEKDV